MKTLKPKWWRAVEHFSNGDIAIVWFCAASAREAYTRARELCGPNPNPKRERGISTPPAWGLVARGRRHTPPGLDLF